MNTFNKIAFALVIAGSATTAMAHEHGKLDLPTVHNQPIAAAQSANQAQQQDIFDILDAGNQK